MQKLELIHKIKDIYSKGGNIIDYLKNISSGSLNNSIEDILISYDFQAGSYIDYLSNNFDLKNNYSKALGKIINQFGGANSIIEVGVGEATTLGLMMKHLNKEYKLISGFDLSFSRLLFADNFLKDINIHNVELFTGNLFEIPLSDNSFDIVYTSHSIEPNGGKEMEALKELYRITSKYLILLEPSFELAGKKARERMLKHGYITNLYQTCLDLNFKIIEYRLFDYIANEQNPTGLIIIEKNCESIDTKTFICPISKTKLEKIDSYKMYSKSNFLLYPIIDNIPCLLKENAILASHYLTNYNAFKERNNIDFKNVLL